MRERLRAHDWQMSPLGPPTDWPDSLRSVVNLILDSTFPMFVIWGEQLATIYNEAYVPLLGSKHPAAIGRSFGDIWPEVWNEVLPMIDNALSGNPSFRENLPFVLQRNGYPERGWFTFSYSPLRDDMGNIGGIYCAVCETTDAVLSGKNNRFALELADRLLGMDERADIMRLVADMVGKYLRVSDVAFADFDAESGTLDFQSAFADAGRAPLAGLHAAQELGPGFAAGMRTGESHTDAALRLPNAVDAAASSAVIVIPMRQNGCMNGIVLVADHAPRIWRRSDLD